jgi:hypothetical protein
MAGASRQKKLSKYIVMVRHEVEYTTEVRVEARSTDEAEQIAEAMVPELEPLTGTAKIVSLTAKAKRIHEGA